MAGAVKWFNEFTVDIISPGPPDLSSGAAAVAALPNGGFVVTWSDGDASGWGVRAQIYNADSSALGGQFPVNTTTADQETRPSIAVLEDGRFVIAYDFGQHTGPGTTINNTVLARIFNPDGTQSQPEFNVQGTSFDGFGNALARLVDGRWIVAWTGQDAIDQGVEARILNGNESPSGPAFIVNNSTANGRQDRSSRPRTMAASSLPSWIRPLALPLSAHASFKTTTPPRRPTSSLVRRPTEGWITSQSRS